MIGWLEASWANVILVFVFTAIVCPVLLTVIERLPLRRELPPHDDCELCAVGDKAHDG